MKLTLCTAARGNDLDTSLRHYLCDEPETVIYFVCCENGHSFYSGRCDAHAMDVDLGFDTPICGLCWQEKGIRITMVATKE